MHKHNVAGKWLLVEATKQTGLRFAVLILLNSRCVLNLISSHLRYRHKSRIQCVSVPIQLQVAMRERT